MAQVTITVLALVAFAICGQSPAVAQSVVPEAGIAAESNNRWQDAVAIYRAALEQEPGRADLWQRVADIEARLGNKAAALTALSQAAAASPSDADLQIRLSQAHAEAGDAAAAVSAVNRALELRPDNPEFVRAAAVLATWAGYNASASVHYHRLQALQPHDTTIALNIARISAWSGEATEAADAYRRYLRSHPDHAEAWIELATAESWRGHFGDALDALDTYQSRFGSSPAHSVAVARVLAAAGRPSRAVELLEPLRWQDPKNYDVHLARTIALAMQHSVGDARDALASVRQLNATRPETRGAEQLVRARLGSSLEPGFSFYGDSDNLQVARFAPAGSVMLNSGTRLSGGYTRSLLQASERSGLARIAGGTAVHEEGWAGLGQSFGGVTLSGRLGAAKADGRSDTDYAAGIDWRTDAVTIGIQRSEGFFVISPRTVELGIREVRHAADVVWTPTLSLSVVAEATYQELSDGNERWELQLSPRHAVVRSEPMNMDLGFSIYRLETKTDLTGGYYDPSRYEAYQAGFYPYFKAGDNVGVSLTVTAGAQREVSRPFRFGGSATAQATFGIYQPWLLRFTAGATHNLRQDSGAFRGFSGSVVLIRRF